MNFDQLTGRHFRLRNELAAAYGLVPWNTGHIDRLTGDLATTERELAAATAGHLRVVESAHADPALLGPYSLGLRVGSIDAPTMVLQPWTQYD